MEQEHAAEQSGLRYGSISARAVHLCVDMQRLFAVPPWRTPWMERILPEGARIAAAHAEQTIFTRFIPVRSASDAAGAWRRYWLRWAELTLEHLPEEMVRLLPELEEFVPPGLVIDKQIFSPWARPGLAQALARREADTLVITGGETDVCVLATLMGAVDRGYRVIIVADALCSSSDEMHEALLGLYAQRFTQQVETACADEVLSAWDSA